jgi:hypothetical protein
MDRRKDGWKDGWIDGCMDLHENKMHIETNIQ